MGDRADGGLERGDVRSGFELSDLRLLLHGRIQHEDRRRVGHNLDALSSRATVHHVRASDADADRVSLGE